MAKKKNGEYQTVRLWILIFIFVGLLAVWIHQKDKNRIDLPLVGSIPESSLEIIETDEAVEWISPFLSGELSAGESFYDLMKKVGVGDAEILELTKISRPVFRLRKIRAGSDYRISFDRKNKITKFEYDIDDGRMLMLSDSESGWGANIVPIEYEIREGIVHGSIDNSLYVSLMESCESPGLAIGLSDIYEWDIDFALDLRRNDQFGILYERLWRNNQYVGPGRILAARFVNQGEVFNAIYFKNGEEKGDYFNEEGISLQKKFLKSPLRYKYISSYFSKNRLHPIWKVRRPHLGVDYAAPRGTPVRAAADGRIVYVGRKGGMGKMIKIRHNGTYSTAYGHLSRYKKNLKKGRLVKQREIIGYVGSTGISTGPHLHYSFYKNGKLVNPMRIKNPKAKRVPSSEYSEYRSKAERILERLDPPQYDHLPRVNTNKML